MMQAGSTMNNSISGGRMPFRVNTADGWDLIISLVSCVISMVIF